MLTLAAHVSFLALLLMERRFGERELPPARHVDAQWITLSYLPPPPEPDESEIPVKSRPAMPLPGTRRPDRPSSAITLVSPPVAPAGPAAREPTAEEWRAQAAGAAARYAEEVENPATFSPPPVVMREPCKPRKSSMWPEKPEKLKQNNVPPTYSEMGPTIMMGGMRIGAIGGSLGGGAVGGGGIVIPLGKPEPNGHLFDDMKEGKTPSSSVPHHELCD